MLLPAEFRWFREYWRDCLLYDDVPCDPEAYEESCTIRINAVLPRMKLQRVRGIFQCFKKYTCFLCTCFIRIKRTMILNHGICDPKLCQLKIRNL